MSERPEESSRQMDSRDGEHASVTVTEVSEESMHSAAARTIDQEALRKLKNRTVAIKKVRVVFVLSSVNFRRLLNSLTHTQACAAFLHKSIPFTPRSLPSSRNIFLSFTSRIERG